MTKQKQPEIVVQNKRFLRIPIKTKVVMKEDNLKYIVTEAVNNKIEKGDIVFVTEKIVAITQGRAIPLKDIHPRKLAYFLSKYVTKTPAGIGLGMPETMEMALREVGVLRILLAAFVSAITKFFGKKGLFYTIAGYKAQSIDGPTPNTIPPYNQHVVLGPLTPNKVAQELSEAIQAKVVISDINDLDGVILGASSEEIDRNLIVQILKDNPLGQDCEQTPIGIIREITT